MRIATMTTNPLIHRLTSAAAEVKRYRQVETAQRFGLRDIARAAVCQVPWHVGPRPGILKFLALLSLIIVAASAAADDRARLQLFYCIHSEHNCVSPSAPVPSDHAKALAVAEKALSSKDDFVGFIDADETTLQFLVDGADSVWVDIPAPELKGSYGVHTNRVGALQIIGRLSAPLSRYRAELKLEFAKWD
jgi:hypothetical protein